MSHTYNVLFPSLQKENIRLISLLQKFGFF